MNVLRQNLTEEQKKNLWKNEGRTEGYSEGCADTTLKLTHKIAKELKDLKVDAETIIKSTGLTLNEIEAL